MGKGGRVPKCKKCGDEGTARARRPHRLASEAQWQTCKCAQSLHEDCVALDIADGEVRYLATCLRSRECHSNGRTWTE